MSTGGGRKIGTDAYRLSKEPPHQMAKSLKQMSASDEERLPVRPVSSAQLGSPRLTARILITTLGIKKNVRLIEQNILTDKWHITYSGRQAFVKSKTWSLAPESSAPG